MRIAVLTLIATAVSLIGGTCLPLVNQNGNSSGGSSIPSEQLAISVETPTTDRSVAAGTKVDIEWSAANLTGAAASLVFYAESRTDLSRVDIATNIALTKSSETGAISWDTTGLSGDYVIYAQISAGDQSSKGEAPGRVTAIPPATFEFLAPTDDQTFAGTAITIRWNGAGTTATAKIILDPDANRTNDNEITLVESQLTEAGGDDELSFNGEDSTGGTVPPGGYQLIARVTDTVNVEQTIESGILLTVSTTTTTGLRVITPSTDTQFLTTDAPFEIKYGLDEPDDVLVDLKIDTDDDATNGNETTILSQRLVTTGTKEDTFSWNGTDSTNAAVNDGIYKVIVFANTGNGAPDSATGSGLIFRRSDAQKALIALTIPAATQTVEAGDFLQIKWRDDDPTEAATIRLTIDDDPTPGQGEPGVADDQSETQILAGRGAKDDGVQDSFTWQIPNSLAPGTYYVFAYITSTTPGGIVTQSSVAPGRFIIKDPANP